MRVYSLTVRNRAVGFVLALAVLGAGAALLVVGLALLAALAVAGGLLGVGIIAYRALRGHRAPPTVFSSRTLDPSLEVFADQTAVGQGRAQRHDPGGPNAESARLTGE